MAEDLDERAIFVRGPVVVFKWRNATGWPVVYASPNAHEVFGYSADEFLRGEVSYAALILPEDAARVAREVEAASEGSVASFVHEPYRVRHRDGSVLWLYDCTQVLRGPDGVPTHYLGYVIDITSRIEAEEKGRELERRLLHAQKLESLGVLAGGVAHDFNNLLTGILGQASLARRQLAGAASPAAEALEQIELLARRAADLTRQLLAYSGRGTFVIEPVDLGEVVSEIVSMLGVAVPRSATLRVELTPGLPAIEGDRAQLQQIAMNLLTNAGEALGGAPGTVTLRTYVTECSAERLFDVYDASDRPPGAYVALEVSDTGCGMDEEVKSRLFDPFFTTKGPGRGLGMSALLGIVRAHKGLIRVESAPGQGTTFELLFPSIGPRRPRVVAPTVRTTTVRRGCVLVVDDEAGIRSTMPRILAHLGYEALTAADGAEALAVFDRRRDEIVAVLLDHTMPGMSGRETLAALRDRAPTLPIIMSSGFSEQEGAAHGASAFLQKPFGIDELERTLATLVTQS